MRFIVRRLMFYLIAFWAAITLNFMLPRNRDVVLCNYDLTAFGGGTIIDIMRTHPMVILGGVLQRNPFFIPPDEFLRELNSRPSRGTI